MVGAFLLCSAPSSNVGLISCLGAVWLLLMGSAVVSSSQPRIRVVRKRLLFPGQACRFCHRPLPQYSMAFFIDGRIACCLGHAKAVYDAIVEGRRR